MWIFIVILTLLLVFLAVVLLRALAFNPKPQPEVDSSEIEFDRKRAVRALAELIRFKTVSYRDKALEDDGEFERMVEHLPRLYPNVFSKCEFKRFDGRALLLRLRGKSDGAPTVLMAHYDVVPADESAWDVPAFEGIIRDGCVWGRGSLDTKVTVNGILFAAEHLLEGGFVPQNDIYFAFSGGEEVNGEGALRIVDYFEEKGIVPAFVLDEGGAVVENVFPGVSAPCGLIGIAEKGMMDVRYTVHSGGGHSSAPKPGAPVDRLSRACLSVLKRPFRAHLTPPVAEMFDTLGRYSTFGYKIIFANIGIFLPLLDLICKKSGGELNAIMRTTVAFTQMEGSSASNVIPPKATLVSNLRLNPYDSIESALAYLKGVVGDENVSVECIHGMNPSRISTTDSEGFEKISSAVASTWRGCVVSPYLMVQCSDSRHYGRISDRVYRFSAMDLTGEERSTIHGNNEKIRIETLCRTVEFFIRLMRGC